MPPDCFTTDAAFMRTMAVCIDTYCIRSDGPSTELFGDYWASHLATTTVGNYKWKPVVSYGEALAAGREDERTVDTSVGAISTEHEHHRTAKLPQQSDFFTFDVTSKLPFAVKGAPLNVTSFINPVAWQKAYNGMRDFETNESGDTTYR
ncbi:hypothetical protein N0V90_012467 [Kalmusia sp. IMI 367209]|nr:hypothetical protein N0V90_012467 [Kalmusia sp. IMI 367209]